MGRRAGVLAPNPAGVKKGVVTPVDVFDGAGRGMGSVPICVDPGAILMVLEGEGTGEVEEGRGRFPVPEEDGDPAAIGAADTTRKKKI